ncbi:hypothetical protein OY671_010444, partial [Metschnikowia pulcherrima]
EDAAIMGGAGSAVSEVSAAEGIAIPVSQSGFPDEFIDHGDQLASSAGIGSDAAGIEQSIRARYASSSA